MVNEDLANDSLIGHAHQTLIDLYINDWRNSLIQSRKLESYRVYKHNFCHEQYFLTIKSYKHRRALTCLRLSSHNLEIEVGRYQPRRPRDLRHCSNCDTADVEDEYGTILQWSVHNILISAGNLSCLHTGDGQT